MGSVGAVAASVVGLLLLAGCGQPQDPAAGESARAASPAEPVQGRLAFFAAQPGDTSSGVLVLDLATGQRVRAGGPQEAWSAAWAGPDRLAVVRGPALVSAQGEVAGELVIAPADGSDEGTPVGGVADVHEVTSSADGRHLAFLGRTEPSSRACLEPAPAQPTGLYVAAVDGSGVRRVADVPPAAHSLVLSPDGRTAAVLDMGDDSPVPVGRDWCAPGEVRLVLIDTATGDSRVVTGMTEIAGPPHFSPDGATVVLEGGDFATTPARDLVFVDVASASARRLSTPETVETRPVFSPDGRRLALLRHASGQDPASTAEIAAGAADGTGMATVAVTGTEDFDLAWAPDGTHLAVAGAVIEPDCGAAEGSSASAPPGGCDTATATTDIRLVDASGGGPRQVSDTVSWSDAGLAFAP